MTTLFKTISIHDLQDLLQAIRYNRYLPHSAIQDELLLCSYISSEMPSQLQDYYVVLWITDIISAEYNRHREYQGLRVLDVNLSRDSLVDYLVEDYRLSNSELESWSVLFIRYCCIQARLSSDEHAQLAGITQRTLSRRHKSGIEWLYIHILTQ